MAVLAVMAHFDADARLRAHARATIQNYADGADRVVVVSTSGIRESDYEALPPNVEFVSRPNYGYDFYSYKWALDLVGDYAAFDRIVISNDSFVGPVVPLRVVIESEQASSCDLMGMTWSRHHGGHAQSFFVTVSGEVARSASFRRFWRDMVPVSARGDVIRKYEVGLTASVQAGGFSAGGYFQPTDYEMALAVQRFRRQSTVRLIDGTAGAVRADRRSEPTNALIFNPAVALADRVLMDARLPLLKFDTLRYDPYGLDARGLLDTAERIYPAALSGVREFLRQTRPSYPYRPHERNALVDQRELSAGGIGYCMDSGYLEYYEKGPSSGEQ